jgi:hypothetical protein
MRLGFCFGFRGHRPGGGGELSPLVRIRAAIAQAGDSANELAAVLAAVHNLTATLHATEPAAPAA